MKKKLEIGIMCMLLLLGGCGNTKEKSIVLGDENMQESETLEEEKSQEPDSEMYLEQESEQANEEPEIEEVTTEESVENPVPLVQKPVYIAQEFLDLLEQFLLDEVGMEVLEEMMFDQEVPEEELEAYAIDPVVAEHIKSMARHGGKFLRTDGDNDGIEDLFAWINDGGSMGNNSRHFLKGLGDGTFHCTCQTEACTQEISFVLYDNMIYFLETDFDYNIKRVNGFVVSLYQDGEVLETLSMTKVMGSFEPETVRCLAGYEETAEKYGEVGRQGFWENGFHGWNYELTGTAETKEEWETARDALGLEENDIHRISIYRSDLDNDGEKEWYGKGMFYPSNLYTSMGLTDDYLYVEGAGEEGNQENVRVLETYGLTYEGTPAFFWVDSIGGKQILLLLCYADIDKEMLYGYLIENDESSIVLEIDYFGVPEMEYEIYTKGINYEYDPWAPRG